MKRTSLYFILTSMLVTSCGVFSKYGLVSKAPNLWGEEYESYLTDENRAQLQEGKNVFMLFDQQGPYSIRRGTIRVMPIPGLNLFKFVEVGTWKTEVNGGISNDLFSTPVVQLRSEIIYDSLGNIINSTAFERREGQNSLLLRESLTLQKEIVNGNEYYLYNVKGYYKTGELMIDSWLRVVDFKEPKNFWVKKHLTVRNKKTYKKDGTLKNEKLYDLEGKLISKSKP